MGSFSLQLQSTYDSFHSSTSRFWGFQLPNLVQGHRQGPNRGNLGCRGLAQPDGPKESGVLAHVDRDVSMHHLHSDLLPGFEEADTRGVASVVVGLACLDAAGTLQKGLLIHHHLIAGKVSEVDVIYLGERQQEGIGGEGKRVDGALACHDKLPVDLLEGQCHLKAC